MLTEKEIESVTTVFRSFESGLRGATINPSVSFKSCKLDRILSYNDIRLGWNSLGWNMLIFASQTVDTVV